MAEIIEKIVIGALGKRTVRRVVVSDRVDSEGNDIRRVFVFYDPSVNGLSGDDMLRTSSQIRDHFRGTGKGFPVVSYIKDDVRH